MRNMTFLTGRFHCWPHPSLQRKFPSKLKHFLCYAVLFSVVHCCEHMLRKERLCLNFCKVQNTIQFNERSDLVMSFLTILYSIISNEKHSKKITNN